MNQHKAIISSYIGVIVIASTIFIAGGKLLYWQALLYLGLAILGTTITHVLTPKASNLAAQRVKNVKTGEAWDRRLLGFSFLLNIITFIIAGLDSGRFGWSAPLPLGVTISGAIMMVSGQLIFALARRENAFFASVVQIESERGHTVCTTGPYRSVRHPGYVGILLSLLGLPLVLGSYWAWITVVLSALTLLLRVQREDQFLKDRLPGYSEYVRTVEYKLIPFVF